MIKLGDRLRGRTLAATVELKSPNRPTAQRGGAATLLFAWFVVPEKIKAADRAKQVNEFHWVKADSHVDKQDADARFESQRSFGVSLLWVVENDVRTPLLDAVGIPLRDGFGVEKLTDNTVIALHVCATSATDVGHPKCGDRRLVGKRPGNQAHGKGATIQAGMH